MTAAVQETELRILPTESFAPGHDKHALIYRDGMVLASIVLWLTARVRRHALVPVRVRRLLIVAA